MNFSTIEEEFIQKRRQRSSLLFGGATFIQFLAALAVLFQDTKGMDELQQDDMKKRMKSSYFSNQPLVYIK